MNLPDLEPSASVSGSLVHAEGTKCMWCGDVGATTIIYGWNTCLTCSSGGAKVRVQRWLSRNAPRREKRP